VLAGSDPVWLRETADGVEITLYVQPGAKKTEIVGEFDGALKLRVLAPPVEGKANAAVLAFIGKRCGVSKSAVSLISGELSRHKRVRIQGVSAALIWQQLS
jgi:uncharacterized protein (TIGR00251 family)